MDITLIATAAMTLIGPYLQKSGEAFAKKAGEDLWNKVKKAFTRDKDKELVNKVEAGSVSKSDLTELKNMLAQRLTEEADLLVALKENLNITPANEFMLENNLKAAAMIRTELEPLYLEQIDASVANEGDYSNRIALLERKLVKVDEKLIRLLTASN